MIRVIRVDTRLASVLDVPTHSKITFYQAIALLELYVAKRKLDDPESNSLDDADPDRHLDRTVIAGTDLLLYCARCNHVFGSFEAQQFRCFRCGLEIKKSDYKKALKTVKLLEKKRGHG